MGADTTTATQRELLIRIWEKQERMGVDLAEIKSTIKEMDECQEEFRLEYTQEHGRDMSGAELRTKRLDELSSWKTDTDKRLLAIEKTLEAQKTMNGVMIFIATVIGSAAIMYIWNILIGG